jgi:hypothetical protein
MPTGYTWGVSNGSITSEKEYILQCARAFGATIMMRDEPLSTPIPDEFPLSSYHSEKLNQLNVELEEVNKLSDAEIEERIELENWNAIESNKRYRNENEVENKRYEDMLIKVNEWNPPTEEHVSLKKFCIDQIIESTKWQTDLDKFYPLEIPKLNPEEWKINRIERINKDILYHTRHHEEEVARTKNRNVWIQQLRESLEGLT